MIKHIENIDSFSETSILLVENLNLTTFSHLFPFIFLNMQYFYSILIYCLCAVATSPTFSPVPYIYSYHFCIDQKFIGLARNVPNAVEPFSRHCLISNLCIANLTFEACLLMNYVTLYGGGREGVRVDDKPLACERQNQSEMQIKTNPTTHNPHNPFQLSIRFTPTPGRDIPVCVRV